MKQQDDFNFFDYLDSGYDPEEARKQQEEAKAQGEKLDFLIHKVFEQTPEGKELLQMWYDALIMKPTVISGEDSKEDGIREGMNRFIRVIKLTVKRVEKGE